MTPSPTYPVQGKTTNIFNKQLLMMKRHIGVKLVDAIEMTRGEYNEYRGWKIPEEENPADEGFLVEYLDGGQPNHKAHEGYISWSPTTVFMNAYRPTDGMNFGLALEALKMGKKVARAGWNGKGMFLFLLPKGRVPVTAIHDPALRAVVESELAGEPAAASEAVTHFDALATIRMWTADKKVLTGWLASQTDMLSDDWVIVE